MGFWVDDNIKKYKNYVLYGKDYRTSNINDDPMFKESNDSMVKFCSIINTVGGITLSEYQLDVLKVVLPYIIQTMFNKTWSGYNNAIMRLYKILKKDIESRRIVSATARREGKTTLYIAIAIAGLLTVPTGHGFDFCIAMPAKSQQTSRETLKILKDRLMSRDDFKKFTIVKNDVDILKVVQLGKLGYVEVHAFASGKVS